MGKKLTVLEFIEKANNIHNNKYDYSETEYINSKTKVCIICHEHGKFYQTPNVHLDNHGCPYCKKVVIGDYRRKSADIFIEESNHIHSNKYDYSKVEYINTLTKVCIICPEHGNFYQTPNDHLQGKGCSKCYGNHKFTTEEFIEKAKETHSNKYNYSKVEYKGNKINVCIICSEHGEFWQKPNNHLSGQGCPICKESQLEIEISAFLKNENVIYERQKHFKWLKNKLPMSLDFYLPEHNIAIECQGRQHFEPVDYFGGDDGLLKTIERDELKYNQCKEHGIEILYYTNVNIPIDYKKYVYTDINELIKTIKNE